MEHEAHKAHSFAEAGRWDREQQGSMTPEERLAIAKILRERFYGEDSPDVRESGYARVLRQGASGQDVPDARETGRAG